MKKLLLLFLTATVSQAALLDIRGWTQQTASGNQQIRITGASAFPSTTPTVAQWRAAMGVSDDDNILFDDADSTFVATTIGAALEEFNDSINAGVPNGAGAKVHWSQILGMPAAFADGTDDGAGATSLTSAATSGADNRLMVSVADSRAMEGVPVTIDPLNGNTAGLGTLSFGTNGAVISAAGGVLTLQGAGLGFDENLVIDLDSQTNEVDIGSTSGVIHVNLNFTTLTRSGSNLVAAADINTATEFAGLMTEFTGSDAFVRAISPTLVTPALGTPTALVLSNATGLPTAGVVDGAITLAKMANLDQDRIIGRISPGAGVPESLTGANVRTITGLATTDNVVFASLQLGTGAGGGLTLLSASTFAVGAGSSIDWNGNPINELGSLNRTFTDHNTPGATETIDVDSTSIDRVFLDSASCEITFDDSGIHAGTLYREKLVYFVQDGSGNRAVTYAVGSDPVGTDPSIDLTASSITIVRYWTFDDWTTIYAMGSGDVPNTVALKAGNTYTGTHDFGGATAIEIENGNDPDLTVEGEVSWDNNGDVLRGFDGTNQVAIGRKIEALHCTVILPNDMADSERDAFWMWSNESGMSFVVTGWKAWSDTDDTTLNIETILADGTSNATVDAVEIATNGTGLFSGADTTITAATIANGSLIVLDFDDTDTPGQVKITIYGYYDANVN